MSAEESVPASVHTISATVEGIDIPLDENKEAANSEFNGTTLHLNSGMDNVGADIPEVEFSQQKPADIAANNNHDDRGVATVDVNGVGDGSGLTRNRPFSASMISRRTTGSTTSRTSMSPSVYQSDMSVQHFFSHREGMFDKMYNECISAVILPDLDGEIKGAWTLIQIDHWDREIEKVFIVSESSLHIITYDFIKEKMIHRKRILLDLITALQIGDIVYPPKSLMFPRQHGAVRLIWGEDSKTSFGQRWNPWCNTLPYITVAHHPVIYNPKEHDTVIYNVDDFIETITDAIEKARRRKGMTEPVKLVEEPILIENYGSLLSMVYNQSWLGYNRDRNGISF